MKIFYIRHAPTAANLAGDIVKDYDSYHIEKFDVEKWKREIGCKIPKNFKLFVSPALRCKETAEALFPGKDYKVLQDLEEFDISELGSLKFWEITKEQFDEIIYLPKSNVSDRYNEMLMDLSGYANGDDNAVIIGHGFYGRLVYDLYEHTNDSTYDILNSKNFQFRNLDMMEIEHSAVQSVRHFTDSWS